MSSTQEYQTLIIDSAQASQQNDLGRLIHRSVTSQGQLISEIHSQVSSLDYTVSRDCLRALFITDPAVDRKEIENRKDGLMDDSCKWILDSPAFKDATELEMNDVLWIHGGPGKGKTMIAMFLIDVLSKKISGDPQQILAYFFCDNTTDKRNNAQKALMSLLHQILKQIPINILLEDFRIQGEQMFSSMEAVWMSLIRVLDSSTLKIVFIVLDGLDECDGDSLDFFLGLLSEYFMKVTECKCHVKWILTSRNDIGIREHLGFSRHIDLEANFEHIARAVDAFIELKVEELANRKGYDSDLKSFVTEELSKKAEGTFLWVALACSELRKRTVSSINTRFVLGKLPSGLSRLYARMLDQVMSNDIEEMVEIALEVLRAVNIALRPLNFGELAIMSGLPSDSRQSTEVARKYAELCGSFLTFRDEYVYLVHQSAKEFLQKQQDSSIYPRGIFSEHEKAANRCLQYITLHWQEDLKDLASTKKAASTKYRTPPSSSLQYPLLHWVEHSNLARETDDIYLRYKSFFRSNSEIRRLWLAYFKDNRHLPNLGYIRMYKFSSLHISAVCGTAWLAERLLADDGLRHVDVTDAWGLTALHWAIQCRKLDTIKLLLQKGADPEHKGSLRQAKNGPKMGTPLVLAACSSNVEAARLLLEQNVNINGRDHLSMTPLTWSVSKNIPSMTAFLRNGAKPDTGNAAGKTALHFAASSGHEKLVKLLLKSGAAVNAVDVHGLSPIYEAAYNGHTHVSELLSRYGASSVDRWQAEELALNVVAKESATLIAASGSGPNGSKGSKGSAGGRRKPPGSLVVARQGSSVPRTKVLGFSPARFDPLQPKDRDGN
jgi:ankyrin repeat protein